jgi:hypothetical protein
MTSTRAMAPPTEPPTTGPITAYEVTDAAVGEAEEVLEAAAASKEAADDAETGGDDGEDDDIAADDVPEEDAAEDGGELKPVTAHQYPIQRSSRCS